MARRPKKPVAPKFPRKPKADDEDFEYASFDALPGHTSTLDSDDPMGAIMLDIIGELTRLEVMLKEADEATFKKNLNRLNMIREIATRLRTVPVPATKIGFVKSV